MYDLLVNPVDILFKKHSWVVLQLQFREKIIFHPSYTNRPQRLRCLSVPARHQLYHNTGSKEVFTLYCASRLFLEWVFAVKESILTENTHCTEHLYVPECTGNGTEMHSVQWVRRERLKDAEYSNAGYFLHWFSFCFSPRKCRSYPAMMPSVEKLHGVGVGSVAQHW